MQRDWDMPTTTSGVLRRHRQPNLLVKLALLERGITQQQLACDLRYDPSHLSKVLGGFQRPSRRLTGHIAAYLATPAEAAF